MLPTEKKTTKPNQSSASRFPPTQRSTPIPVLSSNPIPSSMVSAIFTSLAQSSVHALSSPSKLSSSLRTPVGIAKLVAPGRLIRVSNRGLRPVCFFNAGEEKSKTKLEPKAGSFILTGFVEVETLPFLGIKFEQLSLDEKAEILFLDQSLTTAVVLGVMYSITKSFGPLPEDIYRYDFKEPFNLRRGWLLWAGIGLGSAVLAIALTGFVVSTFNGETQEREADALVRLLPLIGSSGISTGLLLVITGVLAPILEENVFRGFFMVSLTKWVPTPIAVVISAAVFALAHLTPGEFPQLFVLGTLLGFSYAQTRNLLTPITIHACWNSGVILVLTLLQLQGYDIKEILQATQ
ncbi:unnamed protein product [Linum tenue]|uniref:CAAX prenyl protease 2/Lysostaphin resistance protein A-like domain-containing protein n=1 Tax=Linum tenue TaxID=586396 RepID=A0AAV0IX51_9ROSI|nr:unnamed protein product [Linum tenue]